MFAHLVGDLLVAQVHLGAQPGLAGGGGQLHGVIVAVLRDRADDGLQRREPQRQMAGVMLQQNAGEALQRAKHGAVDHHRNHLVAVRPDVERAKAGGQVEVDLRRAALPFAADGVAQSVFELGAVEGAFAGIDAGLDAALADLLQHAQEGGFRLVPHFVRADALFGAG